MATLVLTKKSLVWEKLNKKILFIFLLFEMDDFYNIRKLVSECGVDDQEACLQWCQKIGLLPETRACSKCRRNTTLQAREMALLQVCDGGVGGALKRSLSRAEQYLRSRVCP